MYDVVADYAATIVFLAVAFAAVRSMVFKPSRYAVPERYGKGHPVDAIFSLGLIALLMLSESLLEATRSAIQVQQGAEAKFLPVLSLGWLLKDTVSSFSLATLWMLHFLSYVVDVLTFYFLLSARASPRSHVADELRDTSWFVGCVRSLCRP